MTPAGASELDEFALIERYFQRPVDAPWLRLGIGDDAAVLQPEPGCELVICSDTLVAGRHFPHHSEAADIGWKALAVNLSDLAAMGASPRGFLLNLSLPEADHAFLAGFSEGLFELAQQFQLALVGGDTTRGPLCITITAFGQARGGRVLRRAGAQQDDLILLVGDLGGAALALQRGASADAALAQRLNRPRPFVSAGGLLADRAHAAIDVSDGLAADLSHLLRASQVGAELDLDALRLHPQLSALPREEALNLALHGGDDYALLATMDADNWQQLQKELPQDLAAAFSVIGRIHGRAGILAIDAEGRKQPVKPSGYRHF